MSVFDEFKTVTRRRKSHKILGGVHRLTETGRAKYQQSKNPDIDIERVKRSGSGPPPIKLKLECENPRIFGVHLPPPLKAGGISAAVELIEDSDYRNILFGRLDEALSLIGTSNLPDVICYGLGNFSQSRASKFQLAALLTIKSRYNSDVYAYDPLFFKDEIEILKNLGLKTIEDNEEAKRTIEERTSLVYMPHCPYQLTNNFIHANWSLQTLVNCIVFSNSFGELVDSIFAKDLEESTNYISRIQPYTTEIVLKNTFEYEEVFNGTSIHIFRRQDLERVTSDFWNRCSSPIYVAENCEFVRRSNVTVDKN